MTGAVKYIAETVEQVTTVASKIGLNINPSKTKYMINKKNDGNVVYQNGLQ